MRIASYNVASLFDRPKALAQPSWAAGRPVLEAHARINALLNEAAYTPAIKSEILDLLGTLGLKKQDLPTNGFAILRQNKGKLLTRHNDGTMDVVAKGRADWVGWVELTTEPTDVVATQHTAMVMRDVNADVLCVVEADDRKSLEAFSSIMLTQVGGTPYAHAMLIDGRDTRNIDVGILTRTGYDIVGIRSHVDDDDGQGFVYSRDCPEYAIETPAGNRLVVLVNHFKSKGYGSIADNDDKRCRQATWTARIYQRLRGEGEANVVVCGDFNDWPRDAKHQPSPLAPLLEGTDLRDIPKHPHFTSDGLPGTFEGGTEQQKFDYLLLSPALFDRVTGGGVFRKGVLSTKFEHYPMKGKVEQASDHAAIYADLDL